MEPISERKRYYNPKLDPRTQRVKMTAKMREAVQNGTYDDGSEAQSGPLCEPDLEHPANLVSSLCHDGLHRPALDVDIPCEYIPSTQEGHGHLYFPTVTLTWEKYLDLLIALANAGIIEDRYLAHSMNRGQTLLRPPDQRKHWIPETP